MAGVGGGQPGAPFLHCCGFTVTEWYGQDQILLRLTSFLQKKDPDINLNLAISSGPGSGLPVSPMGGFFWEASIFFTKRKSQKEQALESAEMLLHVKK